MSTIHGGLITEVTINREVNVRGGPMLGGYSTLVKTNFAFIKIKTSHFMTKVRPKLKEYVNFFSSSVHKKLSPGSRKHHDNIVTDMKKIFLEYCVLFS